eukprot:8587866-Pyramimonas_sp.AAC.1
MNLSALRDLGMPDHSQGQVHQHARVQVDPRVVQLHSPSDEYAEVHTVVELLQVQVESAVGGHLSFALASPSAMGGALL